MKKVLIVDDNDLNRILVREILKSAGYATIEAENGREGVDCALSERPDLILMDIRMPVMDGTQALAEIRKNDQIAQMPVVALTASAMVGDREKFIKMGFNAYFPKPVKKVLFLELISNIFAEDSDLKSFAA